MIILVLTCDACMEDFGPNGSAASLRRAAKALGWRRFGGLDLCPACAQKDPR